MHRPRGAHGDEHTADAEGEANPMLGLSLPGAITKLVRNDSPLLIVLRRSRGVYRSLRTTYLSTRYPQGDYVKCNGVEVFCDFKDEAYTWYVDHRLSLALDQDVLSRLVARSDGNVFLDIGAHWGFFTALFSKLAQSRVDGARVIALEPDRAHFRLLERTMARCADGTYILLPLALSDEDGTVTMYETAASCLHSYREVGARDRYQVSALSLDTLARMYLRKGEKIAIVKIDIDGAEPTLFNGGISTLRDHQPFIFMEYAPLHLSSFGVEPRRFFEDLCGQFAVYWVSHQHRTVRRVTAMHYGEIRSGIGDGVTDLLISPSEISWSNM